LSHELGRHPHPQGHGVHSNLAINIECDGRRAKDHVGMIGPNQQQLWSPRRDYGALVNVISKASTSQGMGVHSNQGFGCDFGCDWGRPGTWSGVFRTDQCRLGSPRRDMDNTEETRWGMTKCDLALEQIVTMPTCSWEQPCHPRLWGCVPNGSMVILYAMGEVMEQDQVWSADQCGV